MKKSEEETILKLAKSKVFLALFISAVYFFLAFTTVPYFLFFSWAFIIFILLLVLEKSKRSKVVLALFIYVYFSFAIGSIVTFFVIPNPNNPNIGLEGVYFIIFPTIASIFSLLLIFLYLHKKQKLGLDQDQIIEDKLAKLRQGQKKFMSIFIAPFICSIVILFYTIFALFAYELYAQLSINGIIFVIITICAFIIFDSFFIWNIYFKSKEIKNLR